VAKLHGQLEQNLYECHAAGHVDCVIELDAVSRHPTFTSQQAPGTHTLSSSSSGDASSSSSPTHGFGLQAVFGPCHAPSALLQSP
jgi:hypothetical protein